MSHIYDNWEKLVDAVVRKQRDLELCYLSDASSDPGSSVRSLSSPVYDDMVRRLDPDPGAGMISRATLGELVSAGWPRWLAESAGEAIIGWVPRKAETFEKLDKIGQGTYSSVYRARDCVDGKIVALKKVRFDTLKPGSVHFMAREILILRRLNHPNIIRLEGVVALRSSSTLYLVFEYMEHDLSGLASLSRLKFSEPQVKCYMKQLLCGLDYYHNHGVLHRDIRGANLLIDNSGMLKIADFGWATFYNRHRDQPLTSPAVSLWYRPPELLLGAKYYGPEVDLWSTGCILAELYAGKPIMPGRTEVDQLHKIFKLCGSFSEECWRRLKLPHETIFKPQRPYKCSVALAFKDFPASALSLLEILLSTDPAARGSAASALKSELFTTRPFPCDPASLPKYPPSKTLDVKLRDQEAKRQVGAGSKIQRRENRRSREPPVVPSSASNAELNSSMKDVPRFGEWEASTSTMRQPESHGIPYKNQFPLAPLGEELDQILKEHDRQILQIIRQRSVYSKGADEGNNNPFLMLQKHNREIQDAVGRARQSKRLQKL